jgi:vitamin B12 transporter
MRIALLLLCLLAGAVSVAQITVRGSITDSADKKPLEKVTVKIGPAKKTVTTNDEGFFEIKSLKPGNYLLQFTRVGYNSRELHISAQDSIVILHVQLTASVKQLEDVTVTGMTEEQAEAKKVKENVMPVTILTAKQIENRASNLTELLARQTGVQIRRTGGVGSEARISVRGLEGKRVQIFLDGNPLNTPDGSLGINDLPLQIIERVEIYKGAVPAWMGGDGLGSAVNIVFRHRDVSYIDATTSYQSYNTINTGLILKKTFDKQGIEAGAGIFTNRSDNDYVMELPNQPGVKVRRDHDKFRSLLTGGAIRFHKLWFDEIEIEGAYLNIRKELQGIQRNIQHVESEGNTWAIALGLKNNNLLNNKLAIKYHTVLANIHVKFIDTSRYSYDWENNKTPSIYGKGEIGSGPNLTITKQKEFRHQANFNYILTDIFTLNLNNTFRYGRLDPKDDTANAFAGKNIYNYPGNLLNTITGLTLESRFKDEKFLFSAAVKHYYNKVEGYNTNIYLQEPPDKVNNTTSALGYTAGLRYNFTKTLMIKASHERALRLPNNAELFGDGILITPSILLQPEIAFNNSIGFVYDKTNKRNKRLQLEANAFFMNVKNLIQLSGNGLSIGYVNFAKANIMGADFEVKYDFTRNLYASFNVTYQKLTDRNKYLPGTQNVANPTYKLDIPNTPRFFSNWNIEYSKERLLGKESQTKLFYEGSYSARFNYGFNVSAYDDYYIPSFLTHTISIEQSFHDRRYTITGEMNNLTDETVINNFNQPLPGRTWRIKFRYLLLGKKTNNHTNHEIIKS